MRPIDRDGETLGSGRVGRVRLLRQPFALLLGLRLHLLCTLHGLPVGFALTGAKADERQVLLDILHADPTLTDRPRGRWWVGASTLTDRCKTDTNPSLPESNRGATV